MYPMNLNSQLTAGSGSPSLWAMNYPYTGAYSYGNYNSLVLNNYSTSPIGAMLANGWTGMNNGIIDPANYYRTFCGAAGGNTEDITNKAVNGLNNNFHKSSIDKAKGLVTSLDAKIKYLENLLKNKDGKLSADDLAKIQEKIDALEKLKIEAEEKEKFFEEAIKKNATSKDVYKDNEELDAIKKECEKLLKETDETLSQIKNNTNSSNKNDTDGSNDTDGTSNENSGKIPATREMSDQDRRVMCDAAIAIKRAIDGWGTKYDESDGSGLKNIINNSKRVNADNIIELFDHWNSTIGKEGYYADDKDGFIESLMDDCEGDQKEEIGGKIIDLLAERAEKDGILSKVQNEITAARSSLIQNFWGWRNDTKIQKAINTLVKKMKKLEQGLRDKADQEVKDKEQEKIYAENAKEAEKQKKIDDAKKIFMQDYKDITGKEMTEMPKGIKAELKGNDVVFTCRRKGKDYTGKSYIELAEQLKKDGLEMPTE